MNIKTKYALALATLTVYIGLGLVAIGAGVGSELTPADRAVLGRVLREQTGFLVVAGLLLVAGIGVFVALLLGQYASPARRLAAETRIIATVNPGRRLDFRRPSELADLAAAVNALAERRQAVEQDVQHSIAEAHADLERERNRLAALMSELALAVLVCNADGRILLYNAAARQLVDDGGERPARLVGLGRSVFGIVDRSLVAHGLERIQDGSAPSHEAMAMHGERLLRVHVAAVGGVDNEPAGFVLVFEDVTRTARAGRQGAELLRRLTESARASMGSIRAAAESILDYPGMDPEQQRRFAEIIRDEAVALGAGVDRVLHASSGYFEDPWALADMNGRDLLTALAGALADDHELAAAVTEPPEDLWLRVDSYAVVRAVAHLAGRLRAELGVGEVRLTLTKSGRHGALDVRWLGRAIDAETLRIWAEQPIALSGATGSVRQVVERHGGEVWGQVDPGDGSRYLRLLLPLAAGARRETAGAPSRRRALAVTSRPEFYDFDLFRRTDQDAAWEERRLDELAYTVFDTETTGLYPDQGDEIIAIGAIRIVNARLLRDETFDQLVDPKRVVSAQSQQIHGIRPELLRGQPVLEEVLPAFARFAEDTVLVGHNVAFDMRFLRLKEQRTGVRFSQPVLDTLLLSAVAHPDHEEHSLEAIAERLGVSVLGRHTALGDAVLTGEIFLRLVRILTEQGVSTLGAARDAARETYQARVSDSLYA